MSPHTILSSRPHVPPSRARRARTLSVESLESRTLLNGGSLDTSFGTLGKVTVAFNRGGNYDDRASAVALQPDGKIVVAGSAQYSTAGDYDFAVARSIPTALPT